MKRLPLAGAALLALLTLAVCTHGPAEHADAIDLQIAAHPVAITGGAVTGLTLLGAVELRADHPAFGGFSGLAITEDGLVAVTDQGWLLTAPLIDGPEGARPGTARFVAASRDTDGKPLEKWQSDAEGLVSSGSLFAISYERDHRIEVAVTGTYREVRDPAFQALPSNSGLEALAVLPDGRALAIAEAQQDGHFPVYLVDLRPGAARAVTLTGRLPAVDDHAVTGADFGPDGRLYLVLREFSPLSGIATRIERYRLAATGLPDPATREVLASFTGSDGIDNMEGIALWQDRQGRTRLALISDDNFNALQYTLFLDFLVHTRDH